MQDGVPGHEVHASLDVLRSFGDFLQKGIKVVILSGVARAAKLEKS